MRAEAGGHVVAPDEAGTPDALVCAAIDAVLRRLAALPPSQEARGLQLETASCLEQARGWRGSRQAPEEWRTLLRRVLELHVAVARLEGRSQVP